MKLIKHLLMLAAACACLGLAPKASALDFGDSRDLGTVMFGIPSGDADRTSYVNHLIDMAPGTSDSALGQDFTRSSNNPGPGFPTFADAVFGLNGTSTTIDLGTGLYSYLFAKYDGKNAGSEVWYVGDLSGVITIPATGLPGPHQYGLSGWTLFGPGGNQVPDGGSTVALLGLALIGIAALRTRLQKA